MNLLADTPAAELIAQYHEDVEKRQDVWMYLMLAVFALAVTEMFLGKPCLAIESSYKLSRFFG